MKDELCLRSELVCLIFGVDTRACVQMLSDAQTAASSDFLPRFHNSQLLCNNQRPAGVPPQLCAMRLKHICCVRSSVGRGKTFPSGFTVVQFFLTTSLDHCKPISHDVACEWKLWTYSSVSFVDMTPHSLAHGQIWSVCLGGWVVGVEGELGGGAGGFAEWTANGLPRPCLGKLHQ